MSKTVVIIGALDAGIGISTTKRFLRDGWTVIGSRISGQSVPEDPDFSSEKLILIDTDDSSRDGLQPIINHSKQLHLDAIVNVHMHFAIEDPNNFDHDAFDRSVFVNFLAPNYLIHSLKDALVEGSSITIVTSTEGFIGSFGASAYASTKAAIHNLVKTFANNLGVRNIRCNAVAPGWIGGVMDTDEVFNMSRKITPLGRLGSADEVANVISFLSSDQASFVNGTILIVDGGYSGVDTIAKFEFDSGKN